MTKYIYALRDKKLGCFEPPHFSDDDTKTTLAKTFRGLKLLDSKEAPRAKDMSLYYLGKFDDESGKFELLEHEEKLIDYEDYIVKEDA